RDENDIIKERVAKHYRLKEIDERLRSSRTRAESRLLREARRAGVYVPQITDESKFSIKMELIDGMKVRDCINKKNFAEICEKIGESVALLHGFGIIHGDLTTSNMILKKNKLYLIDFGLGFHSQRIEDKAVDIKLLKDVLRSTHFDIYEDAWKIILKAYEKYEQSDKVIKTLEHIEKRARYKER
ncbi:MAG: KEOPS complex kinase/ATPase Bud32, partial [Candidatus Aenigmatarchaeota archaeon]